MRECVFSHLGDCDYAPRGVSDPGHWIPRQLISRERPDLDPFDPCVIAPMCRRHHHRFDGGFIELTYEQYPARLRQWAAHNGFYLSPRGWRARA